MSYVVNVSVSFDRVGMLYHAFSSFLIALTIIWDTFANFKVCSNQLWGMELNTLHSRAIQSLDFFVSF